MAWDPPPESPTVGGDQIHVWRAVLDQPPSRALSLLETLAPDERARAGRLHFARDRDRFVVGRGVLRAILGRYLAMDPGSVRLSYGAHGKPALAPETDQTTLCFNVSHSDGLALYALAHGRGIGVDLERIRPDVDIERIAQRFFSLAELARLCSLPAVSRTDAFYACWTRKEAYLKARGDGLSLPLDRLEVSLHPEEPAVLLSAPGDPGEASRWSLLDLAPAPGYAAALAVEGRGWRVACWEWPAQ
jgi:4'-phosphopantetheinyl transferase